MKINKFIYLNELYNRKTILIKFCKLISSVILKKVILSSSRL